MGFDLNGYKIHYNDRNNRRKTSMTKWGWEPALKKTLDEKTDLPKFAS